MDKKIEKKITDCIGENLDRLITIDWRAQGYLHLLYQALREKSDGPLTMRAAQKFIQKVREGDIVFVLTGFPVGPYDMIRSRQLPKEHRFISDIVVPETDGVVAAALIARAVDLGFKARPVIFCEEECVKIVKACCGGAGLRPFNDFETSLLMAHTVTVLPFTKDAQKASEDAQIFLDGMNPKAAISIERPGKNEKGFYHTSSGRSATDFIAKLDELFAGVQKRGGLTIAIGDVGNELGMGALKEATKKIIPFGEKCLCGCGGGIGNDFRADAAILGGVSEDAAYAFLACLAYLLSKPEILQTPEMETRILDLACSHGAIDALSGLRIPSIDYIDVKNHNHQIELMREIIWCPNRFLNFHSSLYADLVPR